MIAAVEIAGTSWDPFEVLADVTIRHGRSAWGEAPNASSATITLWDAPRDLPLVVGVGNSLRLLTELGAPRFTGTVTDSGVSFPDPQLGARVTLTAVGRLADLGRITLGAEDYPEEPASLRAARLFTDAGVPWAFDCPAAYDYTLAARPAKEAKALDLLTELATSLGATLFDTPLGDVVVQSLHARPLLTPHDIPAHRIAYAPQWRQVWEVENRVVVKWAGGEVVLDDPSSIAEWGPQQATVETSLASATDALNRAADRLSRLTTPRWQLPGIVTDLTPDQLPLMPGDLALVATDQVAGLPLPKYPAAVEGWTDTQRGRDWTTTLYLSDGLMSYAAVTWQNIPALSPAYTWATIDQATTWDAAVALSDLEA